MATLTEFLLEHPVSDVTDEVIVSNRLSQIVKEADGQERKEYFKFKIKAISSDEFARYQKLCTTVGKKGKIDYDSNKFHELVVVNHTVEPCFKNADAVNQAGCQTPEQYMKKVLLAGEIITLSEKVSELSGFDKGMEDLVEEAKN